MLYHQSNEKRDEQNCCRTLCPFPPHRFPLSVTRHSTFHLCQCFLCVGFRHDMNSICGKIESMYLFGYPSVFFRFIHPRLNLQTLFFCCQSLTITGKQFFYSIIISFIHILILLPFTIRQGRLVGFLNQISFFFIKSLFSYKKAIFAVKYQTNT